MRKTGPNDVKRVIWAICKYLSSFFRVSFLLINYILHLEYKMRDREGGEENDGRR